MSSDSIGGATSLYEPDRRVLTHLREYGADYPALVAGNTGLHIPLVERRCVALEREGLLEAVSGEVIYRITDAGRSRLDTVADGS
ncbi:MAG: DUF2250 domain-containing protein [Halobacteriota archaeon]